MLYAKQRHAEELETKVDNIKCKQVFMAHNTSIQSIYIDNNKIISCGSDKIIKIWELNNNRVILGNPYQTICYYCSCFNLSYDKIVIGSTCGKIYKWNFIY